MADPNSLGNKHECYNCGTRFYDLGKSESICPKCGANQKDSDRQRQGYEKRAHGSTQRPDRHTLLRGVNKPAKAIRSTTGARHGKSAVN